MHQTDAAIELGRWGCERSFILSGGTWNSVWTVSVPVVSEVLYRLWVASSSRQMRPTGPNTQRIIRQFIRLPPDAVYLPRQIFTASRSSTKVQTRKTYLASIFQAVTTRLIMVCSAANRISWTRCFLFRRSSWLFIRSKGWSIRTLKLVDESIKHHLLWILSFAAASVLHFLNYKEDKVTTLAGLHTKLQSDIHMEWKLQDFNLYSKIRQNTMLSAHATTDIAKSSIWLLTKERPWYRCRFHHNESCSSVRTVLCCTLSLQHNNGKPALYYESVPSKIFIPNAEKAHIVQFCSTGWLWWGVAKALKLDDGRSRNCRNIFMPHSNSEGLYPTLVMDMKCIRPKTRPLTVFS